MKGAVISGGVTTYKVVEPQFAWELRSRLLRAASEGTITQFVATAQDDINPSPTRTVFTVTVKSAQFDAPAAFDLENQDGRYIQLILPESGPVVFDVIS